MSDEANWETYEEVAQYLLNRFATDFGLGRVEGHTLIPAAGTTWNIDAVGYSQDGASFAIFECKRKTRRIEQETVAGLAFRITATGASRGYLVTTIGLQKGAAGLAGHEGIETIILNKDSTTTDYVLQFLNKIRVGMSETLTFTEHLQITIITHAGKVVKYNTDS